MASRAEVRALPFLDAIRSLAGVVSEHRASFDRDRRINETVYDTLAEAGLFRLWLPAAVGGPQLMLCPGGRASAAGSDDLAQFAPDPES